ncbi:hypothetical protein BIW11_12775 [Tropilaelaps mercedesae]|uniref:Uncharacterized protein n=1 Tax=Tropilaelaps mercedesae TaxID=418985 RepID=A0A1V9X563_9ACAR|nr:hypothetical protein BIW11_12775 [Tropilaelaps mercedesae]
MKPNRNKSINSNRSWCASSKERKAILVTYRDHYEDADSDADVDVSSDSSIPRANFEQDDLVTTLKLPASLAQELIIAKKVPDARKSYQRTFSDVVNIFDDLETSETQSKFFCGECGLKHAREPHPPEPAMSKVAKITTFMKSLFRTRNLSLDLPTY